MPKYLLQAKDKDDFSQKNYVVELEIIYEFRDKRYMLTPTPEREGFPVWTIMVGRRKFYILEVIGKKTITWDKIRNGNDFKNAEICYVQPTRHLGDFNWRAHTRYFTKKIETVTPMRK